MNILLTGGTGYIGSHAAVVLSQAGHKVVLLDNFCNSNPGVLERLERILGKALPCVEVDVCETDVVEKVLREYKIDAVIHFAGLKSVSESNEKPIDYYANNVQGAISLLKAMRAVNVKTLVFSSSATVYGDPKYLPIDEKHPTGATNPYGRSKLLIEEMLKDVANSDGEWKIICLRYFNPVGSHESGLIGENPNGIPNNLIPYIAQVALGKLPNLNVYGDDYDTPDGTGVRDYIHVMDLAEGHLAALSFIKQKFGLHIFNLGTGKGTSVFEMVNAFEGASGKSIPLKVTAKRAGDIATCYAKVDKASLELAWKAKRNLHKMCASAWNFQMTHKCNNP
jgi:UDP-glucose 4-epimerase